MKLSSTLGSFLLVLATACGGNAEPAKEPGTEPAAEPALAPVAIDASDAGAEPVDAAPPVTEVACTSMNVCTETKATGQAAIDAKERCVSAQGDSKDGPCSHDRVIATCTLIGKQATMFYYEGTNPDVTSGMLKGGKSGCTAAKGKFVAAPKAKPAK